jgi:hypothetical protein
MRRGILFRRIDRPKQALDFSGTKMVFGHEEGVRG